jgi:hypothetical protein
MKPQRGWINNCFREATLNKIYQRKAFIILSSLLFAVVFGYVVSAAGELTYSVHFGKPELRIITLYGENFTSVIMKGAVAIGEGEGKPEIQAAPVRLLLPQGSEVESIDILYEETIQVNPKLFGIDLMETPIVPSQPAVPIGYPPPATISKDEQAYLSLEETPSGKYTGPGIGYCRGYVILTLNLFPTVYIPAEGKLFYHPDLTVRVTLKNSGCINRFYRPGNRVDREWVERLVDNPEMIHTYGNIAPDNQAPWRYAGGLCDPADNNGRGYDYVIITREALFNFSGTYTWDSLMARKEADGLQATKVSVEDILACPDYRNTDPLFDDTPARIREFVRDAYFDWGTDYVLIAGDQDGPNKVLRRLLAISDDPDSNDESDLYWSNLDNTFNNDHDRFWGEIGDTGFDLYSEIFIGSVPCDEGIDVSNWLTKSFYYEDNSDRDYLDNCGFYAGQLGWQPEGDDVIDYTSIYGYDYWPGPDPEPYPEWLDFQYGFETWNDEHPLLTYNTSIRWTATDPNPGWMGGTIETAVQGLRNAINSDRVTLIAGLAHADPEKSLNVLMSDWESLYHNTRPFFLHDFGCHCGDMDGADDGVLHSMLLHSDTELAFAAVYNTGNGWGCDGSTKGASYLQQKSFWDYFLNLADKSGTTNNWQLGKAQAWSKDLMAPTIDWQAQWRDVIMKCLLFGDPAQRLKPPAGTAVSVGLSPNNPPIEVRRGGSFEFTGILSNNSVAPTNIDVWLNLRLPDGRLFGPIERFNNIELDSLQTLIYEDVRQQIPQNAPLGTYQYIVNGGHYPIQYIDCADSFSFTVIAGDGLIGQGEWPNDWILSGWFPCPEDVTPALPAVFAMSNNYPNPFNAVTTIDYQLPVDCEVKLVIYNLLGQKVETLIDGRIEAGYHTTRWNASSFSTGVYFARLTARQGPGLSTAGDRVFTKRMTLLK